jgi:hypothetical protein
MSLAAGIIRNFSGSRWHAVCAVQDRSCVCTKGTLVVRLRNALTYLDRRPALKNFLSALKESYTYNPKRNYPFDKPIPTG